MDSNQRTIFLAVLIPLAFGVLTFVETGGFVLPFPLNEIIFALTSYIFVLRNIRGTKIKSLFVVLFATLNLFSTEFIWSLFTTQEALQHYYEIGVFDTIRFFSYLMLLVWCAYSFLNKFDLLKTILLVGITAIFLFGLLNQLYILMVAATFIPFLASFKYADLKPFHLLWLLLTILNTMTLIMFQLASA